MLYDLSEQVAHCYRSAAKCRELAERYEPQREFYLEREQAWLTLARSFEFSERVGRVLDERQRRRLRNWPAISVTPNCPACHIQLRLHPVDAMVGQAGRIVFERAYVLCPNCGHVDSVLRD
jgi:hypothetical protein